MHDSWSRAVGQDVFVYLYVQMQGIGNYAYRWRYAPGPGGFNQNPVVDTVSGIAPNLNRAAVEALF